jgi:23S rRNA pseudouridine955/2504/2580 synthase
MPVFHDREHSKQNDVKVQFVEVTTAHEGQRLDNFLIRLCKGVPKSHIYKAIRAGQVRVNKGRCAVDYRIELGDLIRVPPLRLPSSPNRAPAASMEFPVVYEDSDLLVINKPSAVAVHGGSGVSYGVIESLRVSRPELQFLELVHRLDRDTSGLLMLAKSRKALVRLHSMMRDGQVRKCYTALVDGRVANDRQHVRLGLTKWLTASGERRVKVDSEGQFAHTIVTCRERFRCASLVEAELKTGRTHQIRVHLGALGHPIVGDTKYAHDELQDFWKAQQIKRMMLHAHSLELLHPISGEPLRLQAQIPPSFAAAAQILSKA